MDAISGGRMELGIGAGWKREEWLAYGYGFPETAVRLAMLHDALEVISRMLEPGRSTHATYEGSHHQVADARNVPKPIQPNGMPIMVGGNGPNVTWRLAARYADELNVDGISPDEVREALPTIRARCEEIDRDPDSLAVSVHVWWGTDGVARGGEARRELLRDVRRPRSEPGDRPAPVVRRGRRLRSSRWRKTRAPPASSWMSHELGAARDVERV